MMGDTISAPFTVDQQATLNRWQFNLSVHPFTCGNQSDHGDQVRLVALAGGWQCPYGYCEYVQKWAHRFMADKDVADTRDRWIDKLLGKSHE